MNHHTNANSAKNDTDSLAVQAAIDRLSLLPKEEQSGCLLRQMLEAQIQPGGPEESRLRYLLEQGFTLRPLWPSPLATEIRRWIGARLFFAHSSLFSVQNSVSILSSQLGRDSRRSPRWPALLESSLQDIARRQETLLVTAGTTLHKACLEFAQGSRIPLVELVRAQKEEDLDSWFRRTIKDLPNAPAPRKIFVSPLIEDGNQHRGMTGPLADRLLLCCAERVVAVNIRHGGKLQPLVDARLKSRAFAKGSLYLHLEQTPKETQRNQAWLEQGAVGWFVGSQSHKAFHFPQACGHASPHPPLLQCTLNAWKSAHAGFTDAPTHPEDFLCHCTRGLTSFPDETDEEYRRRIRLAGQVTFPHPLATLHEICQTRKLRAFSHLNRAGQAVISFSSLPLLRLVSQRSFQSHLQRWDWEPYGLLIPRSILEQQGCRPVIYGDDGVFQHLSQSERPYFQPYGKTQHWSEEQEWRLVDDLDLDTLPRGAIRLFVRTKQEANYLARMYSWPVLWTES